jgi:alcohol dehydrogenase class IV
MAEHGTALHHCKFEVPEIMFGRGLLSRVGACALRLGGKRAFLVSDPGLFQSGWVDVAARGLKAAGLSVVYYDNVSSNPRDHQIENGAREYLRQNADVIIGLGGGSSMDAAKGVAILVSNGGRIGDYEGSDRIHRPLPPVVLCPTTCGTGSDVSQFAIVTDTERRCKMTIMSRTVAPDISLTDPDTLDTLPDEYVCSTGFDALSHSLEAFFSIASTTLTDVHAVKSMRLLTSSLVDAVHERNRDGLCNLAEASLHAGMAFSNSLLGIVHALAHPIGGYYDTAHGSVNAILLPWVLRFNLPVLEERLPEMAWGLGHRMGRDIDGAAHMIEDVVGELIHNTNAPRSLRGLGVKQEDFGHIADNALKDACILTSPRVANREDLIDILRKAY